MDFAGGGGLGDVDFAGADADDGAVAAVEGVDVVDSVVGEDGVGQAEGGEAGVEGAGDFAEGGEEGCADYGDGLESDKGQYK